MAVNHRDALRKIRTFPSLIKYLREELDWPIGQDDFDDETFDYTPEELGIDSKNAAKIQEIKRLRPRSANQPWGIFFIKFEPKALPVVALRRILGKVTLKKRASANSAERVAWETGDLLFVSNYGLEEERRISLAHFSHNKDKGDLPELKVLGWDNLDTELHLDHVATELQSKLKWPDDEEDVDGWREAWRSAFTLRHREVITTSKAMAVRLAELARAIRLRINAVLSIESEKGQMRKLMTVFKESLVHDLTEDDFADMYAQTIAYGLLTARISRPAGLVAENIADMVPITNPFLKELLETFLDVGGRKSMIDFDELGVTEVVNLLRDPNTHMEAVVRDFGDKNPLEDPVIHFYELFLKEYDAKKRTQRGVFYTPSPVVSFIVRSVDELLRTEFGLLDGLADTITWGEMAKRNKKLEIPKNTLPEQVFVQILDPATGTGTFLVEVIELIYKTMLTKWRKMGHMELELVNLWNEYVPEYLLPRLHGYELMMAPYAIAHMKIGLKLYETGYRFESSGRARIYLTNSLEPSQPQLRVEGLIPALASEAKAVNTIKRNQRFTVVIGNPPYSISSSNKGAWIRKLLADYKYDLNEKNIQPLSDDYIKFIRLGQNHIETSGAGILGYISNNSFIDGQVHRQMRKSLLEVYSRILIWDLHGNSKKKEKSPDGSNDKNVFDIMQGVSIGLFSIDVREKERKHGQVLHIESFGARHIKYDLLSANSSSSLVVENLQPKEPSYYFVPKNFELADVYNRGFSVESLFIEKNSGVETGRDKLFVDYDGGVLRKRVKRLLSQSCDEQFKNEYNIKDAGSYNIVKRRSKATYDRTKVTSVSYRPFCDRKLYYDTVLLRRSFHSLFTHVLNRDNIGLCLMKSLVDVQELKTVFVSNNLIDKNFFGFLTYYFPLYLYPSREDMIQSNRVPNLNSRLTSQIADRIGLLFTNEPIADNKTFAPIDLLGYIYAIVHSIKYRHIYKEFLRIDFPRIPFCFLSTLFNSLSRLGKEMISHHLLDFSILHYQCPTLIGSGDFQVEKPSYSDETVWLDKAMTRGFKGVPEAVWSFHIGGYQVCKKWLKDRQAKGGKDPRPGRVLTDEDIDHYQKIIISISETIRIMKEIDEVIDAHGGWPDAFKTK